MKTRVLHITPHLGGGVGRVLGNVARRRGSLDRFICLEEPRNAENIEDLDIMVCSEFSRIELEMRQCDIVQLEWWHHPLMAKVFIGQSITAKSIIWSHTSGLHYPIIPEALIKAPNEFLFTCTASTKDVGKVVNSSGGFEDIQFVTRENDGHNLRYGYLGALNPSKLHPEIDKYLEAVNDKFFHVDFWGDQTVNPDLYSKHNRLSIRGFCRCPSGVLSCTDVLVYLLNPDHYGTTENALLEAMASSVVPIVLNNKVESNIVQDGITGIVVDSPVAFARAVHKLETDHEYRIRLAHNARDYVRKNYSLETTVSKLESIYSIVADQPPSTINFDSIFGSTARDIFYSCAGEYKDLISSDVSERIKHPVLYEDSKSSIFQFMKYFPEDSDIQLIANTLKRDVE